MKPGSLKQKIILFTGLIFVAIIAVIGLIIVPSVRYINTIKQTIELTESRMEQQYQRIRLLKKSISELTKIRQHINQFEHISIESGDELSVIRSIEQLAQTHNVNQQFKLSSNDPQANLSFDFNVSGSYLNLLHYIRGLETFPQYVSIEKMTLSKSAKEKTQYATLSFSATIFRK